MALGIIFSGQGNQYSKMFSKFINEFNPQDIKIVSDFLQTNLVPEILLCEKDLFSNIHAQPLIAGFEYLVWNFISAQLPEISGISGYSLGELTAIAISNKMPLSDLLDTALARATFMTNSLKEPGSLVAISGANIDDVMQLSERTKCYIAIKNSINSVIIGGALKDLETFKNLVAKLPGNIKIQNIAVDIPSHTPLLTNSSNEFQDYLTKNLKDMNLEYKIVSGIDASVQYNSFNAYTNLSKQMSQTINFDKVIHVLYELGSDVILEIGPGHALSNIIKQQNLPIKVRSIDEFNSLNDCITWLQKLNNNNSI